MALYQRQIKSSNDGVTLTKRRKVFISNWNFLSNMSKVSSICGYLLAFCCFYIWISSSFVTADKHTYGSFNESNVEVILKRRIVERITPVPTNYTIIYKYVRNRLGGQISYIEFNVTNCVSTGKLELQQTNDGGRDELVVSANLHIANCTNLNVTVDIWGYNASVSSQLAFDPLLAEIYGDKLFQDKSFALIYAHNETRSMNRLFKIGRRQPNDTQLTTEQILVNSEFSSFPQYEIVYDTPNTFITQIEFEFNSPTATAFLNSSFIEAQTFNAMVYDLSRPEFTVKYNVYGYNANDKPDHYKSILTF